MTPEQFAYWLQGFSEVAGTGPTPQQWEIIQDHLSLVFKKVTPQYPNPTPPQQYPYQPFPSLSGHKVIC